MYSLKMVGNTGVKLQNSGVESRVLFNGGCNTKNARVEGLKLTGGARAAEWTHAAVPGCVEGQRSSGADAAGCRGEQGGQEQGDGGGGGGGLGGDLGVGGVQCTNGVVR